MGGGYSCQRRSQLTFTEVYGIWKLPTACKGNLFTDYTKNIVPEMFFGFYTKGGYGLDIGLIYDGSGKWKPASMRMDTVYPSGGTAWVDGNSLSLPNGTTLYCRAWIEKAGDKYYSRFNVSRTGYKDKDLLSEPYKWEVSSSFGSNMTSGFLVNREIVIASNASSYVNSGCYLTDGKFLQHGLVTNGGVTYVWTDENTFSWPNRNNKWESFIKDSSGRNILRLRDDDTEATILLNKISVVHTNASNGATETVSINFR